jgi:hypothetical protein
VGNRFVKDILAHVTTWKEEVLRYLLFIIQGGKAAKYSEHRAASTLSTL